MGSAIGALARVGEPAVPALRKVLDGPDEILRVHAAYALGEFGPAARAAVPSLIRTLERIKDVGKDEILFDHTVRGPGPDRAGGPGRHPGAESPPRRGEGRFRPRGMGPGPDRLSGRSEIAR